MNRRFDKNGRIVLPKEMRDQIGFKENDMAKITLESNKIIITKDQNDYNDYKNIIKYLKDGIEQVNNELKNDNDEKSTAYLLNRKSSFEEILSVIYCGKCE